MKKQVTFKLNTLAAAVAGLMVSGGSHAGMPVDLGGATLDWKGTAGYTIGTRLEDADPALNTTGNDNFEKGDLTTNGVSLLLEGHLRKDNFGLVASASTFYDNVYQDDKFSDDAEKYHGGYSRILDFYGYTSFAFGESGYADIRLGRHVVAWGEALFFPSISLAQGPIDAIKATTPGTEVKDVLLPEDQLSMQVELTPDLSVMGHYQFGFHETLVAEPGTFQSTSDAVGEGAFCVTKPVNGVCYFGTRTADSKPDDDGQWGVGARYRATMNTELGFYYLNYKDRTPMVEIEMTSAQTANYHISYFDDIDLYGATFSTTQGIFSFAGELSYKDGAPVMVKGGAASRGELLQTNLNTMINLGSSAVADSALLISELAYVDVVDVEARNVFGSETDELFWANHSLASSTSLILGYPGVADGWDMSVPVSYARQISGRVITGGVGGEDAHNFGLGASLTHTRTGLVLSAKYAAQMGDPDVNTSSDRDTLSFSAKYAF